MMTTDHCYPEIVCRLWYLTVLERQ